MKYVAIDIETTGLDSEKCQIIQFGAVIDDLTKNISVENLPSIVLNIYPGPIYGEPFALEMNKSIINDIVNSKPQDRIYTEMLPSVFRSWLDSNGFLNKQVNLAGKNIVSFDLKFLEKIKGWNPNWFHRRVLDPSCLWLDVKIDKELPSLNTCLERAGIKSQVTHDALQDALDTVKVIRKWYLPV